MTYDGPDQTFEPVFPIPSAGAAFFVDEAAGKDTNPGTLAAPFGSIEKGLAATRASGATTNTIVLRKGVYYASDTVSLTPKDSGLTIMAYEGEQVWLSGAKKLRTTWVSGAADHPSKSGNIWKADLTGQGVKVVEGLRINQERAVRARYPNGCTTDKPMRSGYVCQGNMTGGKVVDPNDGFGSDLMTDWVFPTSPGMNQSNWREFNPDTPFRGTGESFQKFQLGIGGTCGNDPMAGGVGFDPPAGYWCGNACEGGAPKPPGCIARWPRGLYYNKSVLPNSPYKDPTTGIAQVWHPGHWASWMFDIVEKNDKGASSGTQLMFGKGGFQGARGAYGNSGNPPSSSRMADSFFVENIFEELDADNEFFYDEKTSTLYYYSSSGAPKGPVESTFLKTFISIVGTQEKPVRDVRVLGVGFRDTAISYLDNHSMPSGGDWWGFALCGCVCVCTLPLPFFFCVAPLPYAPCALFCPGVPLCALLTLCPFWSPLHVCRGLGRIAAVFIKGAVNTVMDSCTLQRLDGNAVMINGYARGTTIQNCNFHEIGDNIVAQLGETEGAGPEAYGMGPDGTKGNQPVGTIIKNNFAYRCGLFEKQSSFYFQAKSRRNVIQDNIFFHGPQKSGKLKRRRGIPLIS